MVCARPTLERMAEHRKYRVQKAVELIACQSEVTVEIPWEKELQKLEKGGLHTGDDTTIDFPAIHQS